MWLLASGNWNNAANAGSQCRNANNYRWNTNTYIGRRRCTDTGFKERNSWLNLSAIFQGDTLE